ncbi:integrase arm-type DNA-binding domain-containing protein [Gammaproteobacteria bacterium AH-315-E17]|nr:integrase arm-type DNA-binding domain-containing protein [Gammaproteobacteria bacterium AH-315-E17]
MLQCQKTTKQLSDTEVKLARPKAKEYNLADGKGLYLRVKPIGSKLWIFNYSRPISKKRANLGLGSYPELSLSEARLKAQELRNVLANDIDPQEYRQEKKAKGQRGSGQYLSTCCQ